MGLMDMKRNLSAIAVVAVLSCMTAFAVVPTAQAADREGTVTSARSFPKAQAVRKDLLAEATSTSSNSDETWGSTEHLDVPHTQSEAEKEAAKAKAEQEQAVKEAAAAAAAAAQEQAQSAAASRSASRDSINDQASNSNAGTAGSDSSSSGSGTSSGTSTDATSGSDTTSGSSVSADALVAYATQFVGAPYAAGGNTPSGWDCSGFVQYVFAQFGISLPHSSGAQAAIGTAVASIADAQPGDIVANADHAAIYIGNGLVINALNPYQGTQITGLGSFSSAYSIRRVL